MSHDAASAEQHFLSRIWDAYADFYDVYRIDTGNTAMRIRHWSELSEGLRQHFKNEFDPMTSEIMNLVQAVGLDDAFD